MKHYIIRALTPLGEKRLKKQKPENAGIKREKLYDKPLTYRFSIKGFNMRRHITESDIKKIIPLLMRPAKEIIDYEIEVFI